MVRLYKGAVSTFEELEMNKNYQFVLDNWDTTTPKQLDYELGISRGHSCRIAKALREMGHKLDLISNQNHRFIVKNWGKMTQGAMDEALDKAAGYTSSTVYRLRKRGFRHLLPLIGNGCPKEESNDGQETL